MPTLADSDRCRAMPPLADWACSALVLPDTYSHLGGHPFKRERAFAV
jgi:hypothetical protein